jgi:hypothetical protein
MTDAERRALIRDLVEERAAILECDHGLTRWLAENEAAKRNGFKDWQDYRQRIER